MPCYAHFPLGSKIDRREAGAGLSILLETGACPGGGFTEGNFHAPRIGAPEKTHNPAESVICLWIFCSGVERGNCLRS
jgi:hypothetical protein